LLSFSRLLLLLLLLFVVIVAIVVVAVVVAAAVAAVVVVVVVVIVVIAVAVVLVAAAAAAGGTGAVAVVIAIVICEVIIVSDSASKRIRWESKFRSCILRTRIIERQRVYIFFCSYLLLVILMDYIINKIRPYAPGPNLYIPSQDITWLKINNFAEKFFNTNGPCYRRRQTCVRLHNNMRRSKKSA
jgi:hypothetical protein